MAILIWHNIVPAYNEWIFTTEISSMYVGFIYANALKRTCNVEENSVIVKIAMI